MPVLNLRRIPEGTHRRLRLRAARHGRSMESEVRTILDAACHGTAASAPEALQDWVARLYGKRFPKSSAADALIAERRRAAGRE